MLQMEVGEDPTGVQLSGLSACLDEPQDLSLIPNTAQTECVLSEWSHTPVILVLMWERRR